MANPVALTMLDFPDHAQVIADLLLGFGDLEYFVLDLVGQATNGDANSAARIIYRLKGAEDRLNVADAIMRPFMAKLKLVGPYGQWLGTIRRCKVIRNQYAHCAWDSHHGKLRFAHLYESAQTTEGVPKLTFHYLELELLKEQQAYFSYAIDLMMYLMAETRFRCDRRRRHKRALPKSRAAPKLHSPPE